MGMFLTDPKCIKQRGYVNIPSWNKYDGEGLVIFHDDVDNVHSECCADIIKTILPRATVLQGSINFVSKDDAVTECNVSCGAGPSVGFDEFIKSNKVNMINNSTSGGHDMSDTPISRYMKSKILEHNLVCTGSAGNSGMTNKYQGAFILAGGVGFNKSGSIQNYEADGIAKDFSMFMGFQFGTSFSAPFLLGMIGLLKSRYGEMSQYEVYKYLKFIAKDFGIVGHDAQYGYGIPILPNLEHKYITMTTKSKEYKVDGVSMMSDTLPVNIDGNVFVPIRLISESLGAKVVWEPSTKTIRINDTIKLQVGSKSASVGNKQITLPYAPFIDSNNRTLVPIRFVAEALNCKVDWIQSESKVMILENSIN